MDGVGGWSVKPERIKVPAHHTAHILNSVSLTDARYEKIEMLITVGFKSREEEKATELITILFSFKSVC